MRTGLRLRRCLRRFLVTSVWVLLLTATASAYTVVMRSGRRVEISSSFAVTPTTLTYEVGPGMQVTIQLSAIDIPATDKANNEPAGSLLKRAQIASASLGEKGKSRLRGQSRSVTNRDLESFARVRRESELAYERHRRELGLPPLEDYRQKAAAEAEATRQLLERNRSEEREAEAYWRTRASTLRTEIATVDAEISYVRQRLAEAPSFGNTSSFTVVTSAFPFFPIGRSLVNPAFRTVSPRPSIFVAPGSQISGRVRFGGGMSRGQVFVNPGTFGITRPGIIVPPVLAFPNVTAFSSPFQPYDFSYERTVLVTRLHELSGYRAGLEARWRVLEDEARRAGAPPGWLREQ